MGIYICKVFTPEFKAKIDKIIEQKVQEKVKDLPEDRRHFASEFRRLDIRE